MSQFRKPLLLDIMLGDRFVCQLRYRGLPFPVIKDGKVVPEYDKEDIRRFVFEQRPSLIGKDITIAFATQEVFSH